MGEALFNLDINSGAYSCARCHTEGWSYGDPQVSGQGAFGWNLTGGSTELPLPQRAGHDRLRQERLRHRQAVRHAGQGTGRMPGFGDLLTDEQIKAIVEYVRSL